MVKQLFHNPMPQWGLLVMLLYINIELVNKQLIGKCLTLNYSTATELSLCLCTIGNKNNDLHTKVKLMNYLFLGLIAGEWNSRKEKTGAKRHCSIVDLTFGLMDHKYFMEKINPFLRLNSSLISHFHFSTTNLTIYYILFSLMCVCVTYIVYWFFICDFFFPLCSPNCMPRNFWI